VKISVKVPEGKTLYQVLREEGFMKSAYCGGRGICGKCRVKVEGKEELACLLFGPFEGEVEIPEEEFLTKGEELPPIPVDTGLKGFGVAIDLGTTGVEAALFDLSTGKFIDSLKTVNFQSAFGADVVTRVELARENYEKERELLLETVTFLLSHFPGKTDTAVVVSNPVMHHFFLGLPVKGFEKYPFKLLREEETFITGKELGIDDFPDTLFYLPPPVKGFVGSDFLANVITLEESGFKNFAVADLGTNAEIGFCTDRQLATSVPAGPAFEGVGLFSGMRAVEGAIHKVFFDGRDFKFLTIGGKKPSGICASGYFDLIYLLKSFKVLNREGTFLSQLPPLIEAKIKDINGEKAFVLYDDGEILIALTQSDIRKFLLAKAAVYGALSVLLEKAGKPERLFFSGAFGTHLDRRSIEGVKLIPDDLPNPEPAGNLAVRGASLLLGSKKLKEKVKLIKESFDVEELALSKLFEEKYLEGMEL